MKVAVRSPISNCLWCSFSYSVCQRNKELTYYFISEKSIQYVIVMRIKVASNTIVGYLFHKNRNDLRLRSHFAGSQIHFLIFSANLLRRFRLHL